MLEILFGSKAVHRILLFIYVNRKSYGAQLHRYIGCALTPIQKALERLEKGAILTSYYEGKTRVYRFNPANPLQQELELLLKGAYSQLSAQEKKQYYFEEDFKGNEKQKRFQILMQFWKRLQTVKKLQVRAKTFRSLDKAAWQGEGKGEVSIELKDPLSLIFTERGEWKDPSGKPGVAFSNVYRWTLDKFSSLITLEHLRHGSENPVFLFHFEPASQNVLRAIDSHLSEDESRIGHIYFHTHEIKIGWRVLGHERDEEISYHYN